MESHIQRIVNQVRRHVPRDHDLVMIALGGDMRFAASQLLEDWQPPALAEISVQGLRLLTDEILALSIDELVHERHLTFPDAEAVGPALLTNVQLAQALGLDRITVSSINLRDGLIKQMAHREVWTESFVRQTIRSAVDFGRRFGFDEAHSRHVAELSKTLFRALQSVHQLEPRHEVILYVAALLHDIGNAVSPRSHHKHSMYLINNGELFGLSKRDVLLAALTARYHRRSSPRPLHEGYATLDWESRANIAKMAAILRVADALDRSNSQRIQQIECKQEHRRLVITVPTAGDLSLEQLALQQKDSLFREVFGMPVLLRNVVA
jgi:exopolyphosphatase/guanosine-5'-triphosphate,3'-diphosphate pyrophosphatase